MNKFKEIKIDIEVYKYIIENTIDFDEQPNDVLKRLLKLTKSSIRTSSNNLSQKTYTTGGVSMPVGLKLRKFYKNRHIEAEVVDGGIKYEDKLYRSPSAAGIAATETSVNGWIFWECFDEKNEEWKLLDNLRN